MSPSQQSQEFSSDPPLINYPEVAAASCSPTDGFMFLWVSSSLRFSVRNSRAHERRVLFIGLVLRYSSTRILTAQILWVRVWSLFMYQ